MTETTTPIDTTAENRGPRPLFACVGVVGPRWTAQQLRAAIRRPRGRKGPGSAALADRLRERLQALADKRWAAAIKGQRPPTPKQAAAAAKAIMAAVNDAEGRCTSRTVSYHDVVQTARRAAADGSAATDGGRVTCSSYRYRWATTTVAATREPSGVVKVTIRRTCVREVTFPAKWWGAISLAYDTLKSGGVVGVQRPHGYDLIDGGGAVIGVAIRVTDLAVAARFGAWEHGRTVADAEAETAIKRAILDAERERDRQRHADEAARAKADAKLTRAARLLARIGVNRLVGYADARAAGACDLGIQAFAARMGKPADATISLPELLAVEPAWAVKIARLVLEKSRRDAVASTPA